MVALWRRMLARSGWTAVVAVALAGCGGGEGVTQPPPATVAAVVVAPARDTLVALGATRQLSAVAQDASGATVSGKTFTWTSSSPSVATVSPTGLVTAAANGSVTITATTDGVAGGAAVTVAQEVSSVTVTPGTASLTAIGATQQFSAVAQDANNAAVAGVRFVWSSTNQTVATVDTNGLASAAGPGGVVIAAAGRGVPGYAGLSVAQAATQLAFSVPPTSGAAGQALSPAIQVEIQDAAGALVRGARDAVTLAIGTNPAGGTLAGTKTVNAVAGIATFSGLWLDQAGTGYTLVASAGTLTGATSGGFDIAAAAPARLAFTGQPSSATAGVAIAPTVTVEIQDAFGNTVPSATAAVTVALGANPGGGTLTGTRTVNAVSGIASFETLSLDQAASGYTLAATAAGLPAATSAGFAVVPAAAAQLGFTVQPGTAQGAEAITPSVRVAVQDAYGNTVTTAADAVTVALGANPGGGTLSGTATVSAVGGLATFADLRIDRPAAAYTLAVTAGGLAGATSAGFDVRLTFATVSAALGDHTCGVTTGDVAYCWGGNGFGQLGDGTTTDQTSPVAVAGGLTFATVSAGYLYACGVTTGGAAYCWGGNGFGQLGDGTTTTRTSPVAVADGLSFATVSAGAGHTCGVTTGGAAYCWGYNAGGQLGDGTTTDQTSPVAVAGGLTFTTVSAGNLHTCGVTTGGAAYCWGNNGAGQLGDGTTTDQTSPVAVVDLPTFATVSAGADYTCGVTTGGVTQGRAHCWGSNFYGQLGDGTTTDRTSPVAVASELTFATVSAAQVQTCGVTTRGAAYCWGANDFGQLGDATTTTRTSPVAVAGGLTFATVSAGGVHTCGVTTGGAAYCWGYNAAGQLGDGTLSISYLPVRVVQ